MVRPLPALLTLGLLAGCTSTIGIDEERTDPSELGVELDPVAQGLDQPVLVTSPAGDARLFIVEQPGRIRVVRDGNLLTDPFLDISDKVLAGGERGLLGLAFDPDFRANNRFFVNYTDHDGNTRVESYTGVDRSDRADPASGLLWLEVEQPFPNHNGGHLTFADGVDGRPEIWHYGLRNPWRFSFDPRNGRLFIADVGQDRWEEINAVDGTVGGLNFGWNVMEGAQCFDGDCSGDGLTLPVAVYGHDQGCSVTGGFMYRGQSVPALEGRYLYADFCADWIRTFRLRSNGTATDPVELDLQLPGSVTSFGRDAQGELYVVVGEGTVYKLVSAS